MAKQTTKPDPQATVAPWWSRPWLIGFLLFIVTIIAYLPALRAGFIWDDDAYVTNNPLLTAPDGLKEIWFSRHSQSQYFPLVYTTLRLEHFLWKANPFGYHALNILLHAANALLVWVLLRRLEIRGALLAAAIFALHPVHVESVAWITELKNTQSTLFYLLALLAWTKLIRPNTPHPWRFYFTALAFYLLALFSKTTVCTLPAALLLILWLRKVTIDSRRIAQVIPFVLLGAAMGLVSIWWEKHLGNYLVDVGQSLDWLQRLLLAARAILFYAYKLIWPVNLTFSYPKWEINTHNPLQYFWIIACLAIASALWRWRNILGRTTIAAVIFFVATLSPLLGFIPLYTFQYSYVADHYQYVASIGLIALFAAMASWWASAKHLSTRTRWALSSVLLLALATLTWRQSLAYKDEKTLWLDTLDKNPASWMAHNNYGAALMEQGNLAAAELHCREALRLKPDYAQALGNLGQIALKKDQVDEAIALFERSIKIDLARGEALSALGSALLAKGRVDEAIDVLHKAVQFNPGNADAYNNLGAALAEKNQLTEALASYETSALLKPDIITTRFNIATTLFQLGRTNEAMSTFEEVLRRDPTQPQFHSQFGHVLALQGRLDEASAHLREAIRLDPRFAEPHFNLGCVLVLQGHRDEAIKEFLQAVQLKPDYTEAKQQLRSLGIPVKD